MKPWMKRVSIFFLILFLSFTGMETVASGAELPGNLANDPVAKALGPEIVNGAIKEGQLVVYGSSALGRFSRKGGKKAFEKRFGINFEVVSGRLREITERIRAEHAVGRKKADVFEANDHYILEVNEMGALEKFRPPAPTLENFNKKMFITKPEGYFWPVHVSAQALVVNTEMLKKEEFPKSYWDIIDPKWKGRVGIRDPRSAGGGAWQMLQFYNHPELGMKYIRQLKEVVDPFIIRGGSRELRDAVLLGQFPLGFGGRAEFLVDVPKDMPLGYLVPKEGLTYTRNSIGLIKDAAHSNAGKLFITWFYEIENLQLWADANGRAVPHRKVKMVIPEMNIENYPLMEPIPPEQLTHPKFFFEEMEKIFR